ncbi:MAG: hypothetical protein MI892_24835, partial [Desulfobacterales bacterium]|nr:hypothetical protein [Desulfobacterales bacterium]
VENYTKDKCEGFESVVIAPQDLVYGLARVYEALAPLTEKVLVFRDVNTALKHISIRGGLFQNMQQKKSDYWF